MISKTSERALRVLLPLRQQMIGCPGGIMEKRGQEPAESGRQHSQVHPSPQRKPRTDNVALFPATRD